LAIEDHIIIKAPIEDVFGYLLDFDKRIDYVPGLEKVIMIDPLPIVKGSRYTEIALIAGRRIESTYKLVKLVKNERIAVKTISSVFPISVDLQLHEENDQTVLSIELDIALAGPFRLAKRIVSGIVRMQAAGILKNIKRIIEEKK
jgi:carbon monoxide dehydrogenase subunit G